MTVFGRGETHKMIKTKKILSIFLLTVMILASLTGCSGENTQSFQAMEDFEQAKIGILTGSTFDLLAKEYFPEADKLYEKIVYSFDGEQTLCNRVDAQI